MVGCNSRLDTMQAAILKVKLKYIDEYIAKRQWTADFYDRVLPIKLEIQVPKRVLNSTHVFHQYTIQLPKEKEMPFKLICRRGSSINDILPIATF